MRQGVPSTTSETLSWHVHVQLLYMGINRVSKDSNLRPQNQCQMQVNKQMATGNDWIHVISVGNDWIHVTSVSMTEYMFQVLVRTEYML